MTVMQAPTSQNLCGYWQGNSQPEQDFFDLLKPFKPIRSSDDLPLLAVSAFFDETLLLEDVQRRGQAVCDRGHGSVVRGQLVARANVSAHSVRRSGRPAVRGMPSVIRRLFVPPMIRLD
jgi:hypothetical protein